jgi:cytochrome c-type biogenesis protein CcmH/NrfF
MVDSEASSVKNPAGVVWSSLGLALTTLILLGVGLVYLINLEPEFYSSVLFLLAGPLAALLLIVGLWRGVRAKKRLASDGYASSSSRGITAALGGLGLLLLGFALFWIVAQLKYNQQHAREQRWVNEAQAVVEKLLEDGDQIPEPMRRRLGAFESLRGERFSGAVWNTQGYEYLIADRDAHFANATIPVRFYITEGQTTNPGSRDIVVKELRETEQLYLEDAPLPKLPVPGLELKVSHPDLK